MTKVDKELQKIYNDALDILYRNIEELDYEEASLEDAMYDINTITVNHRCKSRRGCCKNMHSIWGCDIEISGYMLDYPEKEILTTMVHELLHAFKDSRGHKGMWKIRAMRLSRVTGLQIQRTRHIEADDHREPSRIETKLINCKCEKCGYITHNYRECRFTRRPNLYTHRKCGGHFIRIN